MHIHKLGTFKTRVSQVQFLATLLLDENKICMQHQNNSHLVRNWKSIQINGETEMGLHHLFWTMPQEVEREVKFLDHTFLFGVTSPSQLAGLLWL